MLSKITLYIIALLNFKIYSFRQKPLSILLDYRLVNMFKLHKEL